MSTVWANGELLDEADVRIAPSDRGFLLGDGVFDTFRIADGAPRHLAEHLARLRASAAIFGIDIAYPDAALDAAARDLAARNHAPEAAARLTISRGAGPRGLTPPDPASPFALMSLAPRTPPPAALDLAVSDVIRPAASLTSRHKTLSYLDAAEARRRAAARGADEAVMLNERGEVASASAANLFWVKNDTLHTPALDCGVLAGIARARVIALAGRRGIAVRQGAFPASALMGADAVFLTNSVIGAVPARSLSGLAGAARFDVENALFAALREAAE